MNSPTMPADQLKRRRPPARTPEAREQQLVALAVDLAEKQMSEGKASSQVITHYLKLGSPTARLEREILELQKEQIKAKTEALRSAKNIEGLYKDAMSAFRTYSGRGEPDED